MMFNPWHMPLPLILKLPFTRSILMQLKQDHLDTSSFAL